MNGPINENVCNVYPPINNHGNACFIPSSDYNMKSIHYVGNHNLGNGHKELLQQNDEDFINGFVKAKGRCNSLKGHDLPIKIYEAKKYLMHVMTLKQELELDIKLLDVTCDDFDMKWEEIVNKQIEVDDILSKFKSEEALNLLKTAILKRKKKRVCNRKRKAESKRIKVEREDFTKKRHNMIDKILNEKVKEVESLKRKEALKRQADTVLHEVRRKKYEAKKMLNMLSALLKLRELRSQQEVAQGGYCSQKITETFNSVITYFQDLWKQQSEVYNLEEKGLKVMLEESEIPQMKIPVFHTILNQWEQALFGTPSTDENCQFLMQADDDINSMILIRREWDKYVTNTSTPLSSYIPVGWIVPPETDNEEWRAFVRTKKKP